MKSKDYQYTPKNRRGLSSIVGALLFVVLMVATFSVLGVALNSQTDIVETSRAVADLGLKQQQEDFKLDVFAESPVAGQAEIHIEVRNEGQNSVEIFTVVVAEITNFANDFPTTLYDIPADSSFITPKDQHEILPLGLILLDLAVLPIPEEFYTIKVISSLGTIETFSIVCTDTECGPTGTGPGEGSLTESLFFVGASGVNTKTSTVIMFVTNTSNEKVTDVQPFRGFAGLDDCDTNNFWTETIPQPGGILETITNCSVFPNASVVLGPYESTIFRWDFTVGGDIDAEFQFCNYAIGTDPIPNPITSLPQSCDEITIIDPNDCDGCGPGGDTIILIDDLLIRPSLFMIIPAPFGLDTKLDAGQAIWGVNVVNPTKAPMDITKVTIVSYPPGANANHLVFDPKKCNIFGITPAETQPFPGPYDWSCPGENTIMWQNTAFPITINPYSGQEFLVKIDPGNIVGSVDLDALIVQANAFTTTGSFGKSSYQTTMYDIPETMVNVFLTDADFTAIPPEDPMDNAHIFSARESIQDLVPGTYQITLADFDTDNDTYIKAGARIVINVPREWTDVIITGDTGFAPDGGTTAPDDDRVTPFDDSSTQIIAVTTVDIGGDALGNDLADSITITFTANPPDNKGEPLRPYIMYVLAYGETGNLDIDGDPDPRPIGPLNEIFLQVVD